MQSSYQQNRIGQTTDDDSQSVVDTSKEFVSEHAMPSALTVFGIGLGLGVALGCAIAGGSHRRNDENAAHRLGRRMLDAISNAVPDSLSKLGH